MKVFICFILGLGIGVEAFYFAKDYVILSNHTETSEAKIPTTTPDPSPLAFHIESPTLTPTFYLTQTIKPTSTSTPAANRPPSSTPTITQAKISIPAASSQEINTFIDRFSGQYGVDPNVIRYIAICESGFNSLSVSRNGLYAGLFQFSSSTWNTYRIKIGEDINPDLRFNAEEAVQTAAYVVSIGKETIWPNCLP